MTRIYVVEDSVMHARLIASALETVPDAQVEFFDDGLEAYLRVQADPPDLIVLDIILPSLSGLAMARLLKFHELYRNIRILMSSSILGNDIDTWVRRAGVDAFVPKPINLGDFLAAVERLR